MKPLKPITLFLIICLASSLQAQQLEIGLMRGIATYSGDISHVENLAIGDIRSSFGIFARWKTASPLAVRAGITLANISAEDAKSPDQTARNLHFFSPILEFQAVGEYHFANKNPKFSPYVFGGVAAFYFNPQAEFEDDYVELQPIGTEGQGLVGYEALYQKWQIAIPMGVGMQWYFNTKLSVGLELGIRKTFTDYLDDVSGLYPEFDAISNDPTRVALSYRGVGANNRFPSGAERGSNNGDDWYWIGGVTLTYQLFSGKGIVCPKI